MINYGIAYITKVVLFLGEYVAIQVQLNLAVPLTVTESVGYRYLL